MENYYRKILEKIADNHPVALETVITGEEGSISAGITRCLTEVTPVADSHGRRFARVTAEQTENQLTVREPILPQESRSAASGPNAGLTCVWWTTGRILPMRPDFRRRPA